MSATYKGITATAQVAIGQGKLYGFFCSSASGGPTLTLYDSPDADTSDPQILQVFTPVAGTLYRFAGSEGVTFSKGLYAVIANTVTGTFFYEP